MIFQKQRKGNSSFRGHYSSTEINVGGLMENRTSGFPADYFVLFTPLRRMI
jgi:hypothetical protein